MRNEEKSPETPARKNSVGVAFQEEELVSALENLALNLPRSTEMPSCLWLLVDGLPHPNKRLKDVFCKVLMGHVQFEGGTDLRKSQMFFDSASISVKLKASYIDDIVWAKKRLKKLLSGKEFKDTVFANNGS